MGRPMLGWLYALTMVAVVVGWTCCSSGTTSGQGSWSNLGIVLVFGAFYLRFLRTS